MNKKVEAATEAVVHTSAQVQKPNAKREKPKLHQPTVPPAPDEFHGKAGRYVRDPATGVRTLAVEP